jgi:hypothetical protein
MKDNDRAISPSWYSTQEGVTSSNIKTELTATVETRTEGTKRRDIGGCGKGYIEERAYLSTKHPRLLFRARAHQVVFGVVVS